MNATHNIRLSRPYLGSKPSLMTLIEEVLDSGFLVQGRFVSQFEQEIAAYLGIKHAVAVSSGTAALHLSLISLGIGAGDEVIVPAYTFPATANVVELVGATPVFVDVDLLTYNIDLSKIKESLTPRTKALIPVHIFGNPADMDGITEIARESGLRVIEDAAGALGSVYRGGKCGTIGDIGCFSFHPRKIITTGEGGMVVTNIDTVAERVRTFRNQGAQTSASRIDFIAAGLNYRMNELEAVLGIIQMQEIDKIIAERQDTAKLYMNLLQNNTNITSQEVLSNCSSVWQAFVVRVRGMNADSIINSLKRDGIEANIGTYALHILQFYATKYAYYAALFPNAYELYRKSLALPFYNGIKSKDVTHIAKIISQEDSE